MCVRPGWVIGLVLSITAIEASDDRVTGYENDILNLPCNYTVHNQEYTTMCWGRGDCPYTGCYDEIIKTDGEKVTWRKSDRYRLLGNVSQGDVSMAITGATKEDEGTYCCRVKISGAFNDLKKNIKVEIQEVMAESSNPVIGYENDRLKIPCSYTIQSGGYSMCWGRGDCPYSQCNDEIIWTDGEKVTWRKSDRYRLLGDISQGDVSMTITGATKEDEGTYCCRVEVPGWFNDLKKNFEVKIEKGNPKTTDHPATTTKHDMFTELEQCTED